MDLPIYDTLVEFQKHFEDNFFSQQDLSKYQFLREYQKQYESENILLKERWKELGANFEGNKFKDSLGYAHLLLLNEYAENVEYTNAIGQPISENDFIWNIVCDLEQSAGLRNTADAAEYLEHYIVYREKENLILKAIRNNDNVLLYLDTLLNEEKILLLRMQGQPQQPEQQPILTNKQIEKIGLFVRSGIINFLRESNPGINDSQIARFLRELTSDHLENAEAVRPHLTSNIENIKHPLYKDGAAHKYDLILNKFGISPF